jgi:putative transcriptional regulator
VRIRSDGRKQLLAAAPFEAMTAAETEAAAASDPDNPPLTKKRLAQLHPVPRVKTLRRALALTQEEFAARYHIPLGTLRDWEQGRSEPDQPARSYLVVIARDPDGVRRALEPRRRSRTRRSPHPSPGGQRG